MDLEHYHSYLQVDLGAIERNVARIRRHIGPGRELIPVVKGNAYGLGTAEVARTLSQRCGVRLMANANLQESIQIRQANIPTDLMILGGLPPHAIPYAAQYDVQPTVFNRETAELFSRACRNLGKLGKIQIKLETGMGRVGVKPGPELDQLLDCVLGLGNLEIAGVFTHYATAYQPGSDYTRRQLALFQQGVEQMEARGIRPPYVHSAATAATVWLPESHCTHVRCGSLYLGYSNLQSRENPLGVEEPATWRAFITNIRRIEPGESVGYQRHFTAQKPTTVATVDIGYSAGLNRPLALAGGPVLVKGRRTRYLGVCMDQCFVDVTDIDCQLFDQVTLLGRDGDAFLSLFELADFIDQNIHSLLSAVNPNSVLRVYEN